MAKNKWEEIADIIYANFNINEEFSKDKVESHTEIGKIRSNTWNALINHEILVKASDDLFTLLPRKEKENKQKKSNTKDTNTTLSISKSKNQYYGQYFEEAVVSIINNQPIVNNIKTNDHQFRQEEIDIMNDDAYNLSKYINAVSAKYVGRQTSSANCDIIADDKEIELKYSQSTGTYYNTSVSYFDQFGLISFKQYLKDYGVLSFLSQYFGDKVYDNLSPVSKEESSDWRKKNPQAYEELKIIEAKAREAYVTQVFDYLTKDKSRIKYFAQQMLTKEASGKHTPDSVIIYQYDTDKIIEFTKEEILAMNSDTMTRNGFTFKFNGFHTTVAWQNGTGLNNPTIRVYLDKKGK